MNLRAIIFAGTGLFLSCTATAVWVGHDMADIRARQLAKDRAACAAQASSAQSDPSTQLSTQLDPNTGQPLTTTPPASTTASSTATCPKPDAAASSTGTDGSIGGADPAQSQDGSAAADAQLGEPVQSTDYPQGSDSVGTDDAGAYPDTSADAAASTTYGDADPTDSYASNEADPGF
jgi:hypothetical protein